MSKRIFFFLLAFAALFYWFFIIPESRMNGNGSEGKPAPDFFVKDEEGKPVTLAAHRGKVVLLHFWATWCGPCVEEFPTLNELYKKMERENFVLLAISQDEEGIEAIEGFRKRVKFNFPIGLDVRQEVSDLYGTYRLPETYLINKEGKIVKKFVGPQDWTKPKIQNKIRELL